MKTEVLKRGFSENRVKDNYSRVAWFYNGWSRLTELKAAKRVIKKASIKDGESVLEVAVGTGQVFSKLTEQNPNGLNEGIDLSESMLSRAEKLLRKLNTENYHLQTGTAYHLPFGDNTFDLLVNNFMIDLLPENDFETILKEFYRVLKPTGRVVISTMAFGKKWYNKIWHWIATRMPGLLTGCRPVSIADNLEMIGFVRIDVESISQNTFPAEVIYAEIAGK